MKKIPLSQGKMAFVDDADFELVSQHRWCALKSTGTFYAATRHQKNGKDTTLYMHRLLLGEECSGRLVDHENHDGLDNRRANLRVVTLSGNMRNRRSNTNGTSRFKGVYHNKKTNRWIAQIKPNGSWQYLGCFTDEESAARAYDVAATKYFGEYACLNFPPALVS